MKKIDYKTAYETLYIAYTMLLKEITDLRNNKLSTNEIRIMHGLPPIETTVNYVNDTKTKLKKLDNLNIDYYYEKNNYESLSKEEIGLDIVTLQKWVNKIVNYLRSD